MFPHYRAHTWNCRAWRKLPGGHGTQVENPAALVYVPLLHVVHAGDPRAAHAPGGQMEHVDETAAPTMLEA